MPPIAAYVGCLGPDLLGADIRFCSEFGLNVHGKSLYVLIASPTDARVISDRNVHDRLIEVTGAAYDAWLTRRTPGADALTLTVNDVTLALPPSGTFDVVVPWGPASFVLDLTTAAGEETSHTVEVD
jgi:hypothetical protein